MKSCLNCELTIWEEPIYALIENKRNKMQWLRILAVLLAGQSYSFAMAIAGAFMYLVFLLQSGTQFESPQYSHLQLVTLLLSAPYVFLRP